MYCVYCGAKAPDDASFCGSCGRRIGPGAAPNQAVSTTFAPPDPGPSRYAQPAAATAQPASFGRRIGGYIGDAVVELGIGFAVGFIFAVGVLAAGGTEQDIEDQTVLLQFLAGTAGFLYVWLASASGATLGMRAVGIRIAPDDGSPDLSLGMAFWRTVVFYLGGIALGLGYLWMLWDGEKKTWHDHASNSRVVRVE